jgi:CheY-like chemotaxis protein
MNPIEESSTNERQLTDPKDFFHNSRKFFFQNRVYVDPCQYDSTVFEETPRASTVGGSLLSIGGSFPSVATVGGSLPTVDPFPIASKVLENAPSVSRTNRFYDWFLIQRTSVCQFLGQKLINDETVSRIRAENAVREAMMDRDIAMRVTAELQGTIANLAHDVKSPCTALTLGIESIYQSLLLEQNHRPSKANSDNLEIIKEMFKILSLMESSTNRVKDFSKVTCGLGLVPTLSPLNIVSCIQGIVEEIELTESIDFFPPPLGFPEQGITDAGWFKDNFSCVLQNAVKYSSGLKIAIKFSMVTDMGQKFAHVCVTDSGQTLSALRLLHLFDCPTQRRRGSVGGMGIGLVCLAERMKVRTKIKISTTFSKVLHLIMLYNIILLPVIHDLLIFDHIASHHLW